MSEMSVLFSQRNYPTVLPFRRSEQEEKSFSFSSPSSPRPVFEAGEKGKAQQQAYFSSLIKQMSVADNETRAKILRKLAETVARENPARSPSSFSLPSTQTPIEEESSTVTADQEQVIEATTFTPSLSSSSSCVPAFTPSPPPSPSPSASSEPLSPTSVSSSPFSTPPSSPLPTRGKKQKRAVKSSKKQKKQKIEQQDSEEDGEERESVAGAKIDQDEDEEDALGLKPTDKNLDLSTSTHTYETFFGKQMTVLHLPEVGDFLIGREVATLLRRQTFNMYRSMKLRGIGLLRAIPEHVEHFALHGVVKVGTHSVTLVPYSDGSDFIKECKLREIRLDKKKRKQKKSGLLELYLIANEFLSDSVEKD